MNNCVLPYDFKNCDNSLLFFTIINFRVGCDFLVQLKINYYHNSRAALAKKTVCLPDLSTRSNLIPNEENIAT